MAQTNISNMPTIGGKIIKGVSKSDGNITAFHLSDGSKLDYNQALSYVKSGNCTGLVLGGARDGSETIHGVADGDPANNLDSLPVMN